MVVVFLSGSAQLGGAELCLLDMLSVLRRAHPDWTSYVIAPDDGPLFERAARLGSRVTVLPFPRTLRELGDSGASIDIRSISRLIAGSVAAASYLLRLAGVIRKLQPTVIHSNSLKMHVLAALTKPHGAKLVWHMHDYLSSRPLMRRVLPLLSSRAEALVAVSENVAEDLKSIIRDRSVTVIHNSVDLDQFSPRGRTADLDKLCGLRIAGPGTVRVGLIATMAWWKGHRIFLEAIGKLDPRLAVRAYFIGGEIYRTKSHQESIADLKSYAEELGIARRVGFAGFIADPAEAIRGLDIAVHCSTRPEPFGRVIIEAMACGKPVISSGLGGAAEILSCGDFSRRYDGTAAGLAQAISSLATDPAERTRLGTNGLKVARASFARDGLAVQLISVYEIAHRSRPISEFAMVAP